MTRRWHDVDADGFVNLPDAGVIQAWRRAARINASSNYCLIIGRHSGCPGIDGKRINRAS